ncbi:DUF3108 domain-containing protein [Flavobacterium jejuense]|uniref:DUF3108 domain-containing protein n=1 Tax=Flavobacterium jejuense TaxID=1544455 RepID=A0ABX0IRK3_9FLAO|nr:DUF3108 domain-containing protein [Flavobacterium jejuense]NHN26196.1 DUF3108 domain-containing protein [Flavobacterium jejuense]
MKNRFLIIILLVSNLVLGQQYDGLHIEKSKIDKNNSIYTLGKEFVFNIKITENDSIFFIKENNSDNFKLSNEIDSLKISEIHLTVIKPRMFQRTNKNQTEVYYSYEPNPTTISSTGIVENDENIWVHPPRNGFFKSLETCPFPYIKLNEPIGYKWTDSMSIGNHWADEKWGLWSDRLLLNYEYKISGKEKIQTKIGELECIVISAIATSNIGESKLKSYFSYDYGFVKLEYTLFTGMEIELNIAQIINGPILRDGKEFFENKYK